MLYLIMIGVSGPYHADRHAPTTARAKGQTPDLQAQLLAMHMGRSLEEVGLERRDTAKNNKSVITLTILPQPTANTKPASSLTLYARL
jgi:hypothetical protein